MFDTLNNCFHPYLNLNYKALDEGEIDEQNSKIQETI